MTSAKRLSYPVYVVALLAMIGICSQVAQGYGNDAIGLCPESGVCFIRSDGRQAGCSGDCRCISDRYNEGIYDGWGHCYG
uniref:Putative secreted protein n=1 Tax=Amblyomma americanum TaxID=6943 RepID=A0A0C9SCQ1_AMBAM